MLNNSSFIFITIAIYKKSLNNNFFCDVMYLLGKTFANFAKVYLVKVSLNKVKYEEDMNTFKQKNSKSNYCQKLRIPLVASGAFFDLRKSL